MCAIDRRVTFCACECGSVLPSVSLHMTPPRHFEGVSAGPIGCLRVAANDVIILGFSCAFECCAIYGFCGSQGSAAMFANSVLETCVEIWQFGRGDGVVEMGVS